MRKYDKSYVFLKHCVFVRAENFLFAGETLQFTTCSSSQVIRELSLASCSVKACTQRIAHAEGSEPRLQ